MTRKRYSVEHLVAVRKQAELGPPVADLMCILTKLVGESLGGCQVSWLDESIEVSLFSLSNQ